MCLSVSDLQLCHGRQCGFAGQVVPKRHSQTPVKHAGLLLISGTDVDVQGMAQQGRSGAIFSSRRLVKPRQLCVREPSLDAMGSALEAA